MDQEQRFLLHLKGNKHVELMRAASEIPDSFYETYSAFANSEGGTIYLGIKEGNPNLLQGVLNPEEQIKSLLSSLENKKKVSVNVLSSSDYKIRNINGKKIIEIHVRKATRFEKPVYLNGSLGDSYKRVGEGDFRLNETEIQSKLIDRNPQTNDSLINNLNLEWEDLDQETIKLYRTKMNLYRPNDEISQLSTKEFLTRIGAYRRGEDGKLSLTKTAVLFFGKWQDIISLYPNYMLDYQYYDGIDMERWKLRFSSDDLSWPGNVFRFYLKVEETIAPYLPNPFKREKDNNYNGKDILEACLEALVNALSNTSYILPGNVLVKQSPNYFIIRNPGDILVGKEQAILGGLSIPRNPGILSFFRLIGVAEKTGLGIPKVFTVASRYGFATPNLTTTTNPEMTELKLSFLTLSKDTPSYALKLKVISYLSEQADGSDAVTIARDLNISSSQAALITRELIAAGILVTNNKKKKGRKLYLRENLK